MRSLRFEVIANLPESYLICIFYHISDSHLLVSWCRRSYGIVRESKIRIVKKLGNSKTFNCYINICEVLNEIGFHKSGKIIELWFDDCEYDVYSFYEEVLKRYGAKYTFIFNKHNFFDFRRWGLNVFHNYFILKTLGGYRVSFLPSVNAIRITNFKRILKLCYNIIMPKNKEIKKVKIANRKFASIFYNNLLSQLKGEEKQKKRFLNYYINTLSFRLAVIRSHIDLETFERWYREDEAFRKIYDHAKLNRTELIEFLLLCKGGLFGEEVQKEFSFVDEKVLSKLLTAYSIYEANYGLTGSASGQNYNTAGFLGREIKNTSIEIEE